ncbi:uncharacterized protein BJX67DRAFT_55770 [Aspergillus lucknowensis]|uniref:Uncharacterized protein n=1 Tax=Aspergillus lucknowensis TaxID=176173 RepID=A0ABR4LV31_9EURO
MTSLYNRSHSPGEGLNSIYTTDKVQMQNAKESEKISTSQPIIPNAMCPGTGAAGNQKLTDNKKMKSAKPKNRKQKRRK